MALACYTGFTDPGCYLASGRVDALGAAGVEVDWRAVAPHAAPRWVARPLGPDDRLALQGRLADLARLVLPGERLAWSVPNLARRIPSRRSPRTPRRPWPESALTCAGCCTRPTGWTVQTSAALRCCAGS